MRVWRLAFLLMAGCTGGLVTANPAGDQGGSSATGDDAAGGTAPDSSASEAGDNSDATPEPDDGGAPDGDASCLLWVDDAGITHGCSAGGHGPGDKDDGGGAPPPPPPDAALDASDLPLGAPCWDNAQCQSQICFDYSVKGTFCTQRCWYDSNCPPPMLGCNGMGVCRVP